MISGLLGFSIINNSSSAPRNEMVVENQTAMLFEDPILAHPEALEMPQNIESRISLALVRNDNPQIALLISEPAREESENTSEGQLPHNTVHDYYVESTFGDAFSERARLARLRARRSQALSTSLLYPDASGIMVRDSKVHPTYAGMKDGERRYNRRASWQLGVYFTPEVIFFPDDSIPNQRSYTFEVTGKWLKNDFFVESGLGLSFSSDDGVYAIDYEKFLGSYDDVYNVTFDTSESGAIVPVYHTTIENVYDSISKFRVEKTKNKYTYLQIPVYIGFQKEINRFGWFIKGGPILSILMNENIPTPDPGTDRIIDIDQAMPGRVNTHWQLGFSAGVTYQLSRKVSLAIEPTFKYYLNSQYQRKYITTSHPYSFGLRTGLLFNF